jgi:hypothetical protein
MVLPNNLLIKKHIPSDKSDICFYSKDIEHRYSFTQHKSISFNYFLLIDDKVISYIDFMDESEKRMLGFLEYVVHEEDRKQLSKKFPVLTLKTLYLCYIYTDKEFRQNHFTSYFLLQVTELLKQDFRYLWLKRETDSKIFSTCGFLYFREAIEKLTGLKDFAKSYHNTLPSVLFEGNMDYMVKILD